MSIERNPKNVGFDKKNRYMKVISNLPRGSFLDRLKTIVEKIFKPVVSCFGITVVTKSKG